MHCVDKFRPVHTVLYSSPDKKDNKGNKFTYYIPKKDSHSLRTGVTVQYFLHIARSQVHIARS